MKKIFLFGMALMLVFCTFSQYTYAQESKKVIMNQVYGTGNNIDVPVSHSFIELYNPTGADISLDGMSVQYSGNLGDSWQVYPLAGTIRAYSFYLIRGQLKNDRESANAQLLKWVIEDEMTDIDFPDLRIDNKFYKVAMVDGTGPLAGENPYGQANVLDLLGAENTEKAETSVIDAYETKASRDQSSKQKSLRRVDFADTDNNEADFTKADYRLSEDAVREFAPRNSKCGDTLNGLPDPDKVVEFASPTPEVTRTPVISETPMCISPTPSPQTETPVTPSVTPGDQTPTPQPTNVTAYVPVKSVSIDRPAGKYKTSAKAVVYKKASDKKGKITTLKKGTSITVSNVKGMYAKVKVKGKTGYVKITNLTFSKEQNGKIISAAYAYKNAAVNKGKYKRLNKNTKLKLKRRFREYYTVTLQII